MQGVGFRWFVRETARRVGLAGWVRNHDDGRVEIAAAGGESEIEVLMHAARTGPLGARVERVVQLPLGGLEELPMPFTVVR